MTIHEVENITGLPRANVRFYESEGLINPQRAKNGYRDYSEEDIEKLNKIKLLRALDFSIEDIRSLDSDSADFTGLLKQRVDLISSDKSRLTRSQEVLEKMLSDGVDYASLNCGIYLEELQKPSLEISAPAPIVPQEDSIIKPGVWRRYFARGLDFSMYSIISGAVLICGFNININTAPWFSIVLSFINGFLLFICEPVFLCLLGTTPGKWLLGIRVTGPRGQKLSYFEALSRTWELLMSGFGLMIPIVSLYRMGKSFKTVKKGEENDWEIYTQLRLIEKSKTQIFSYIASQAVITILLACVVLSPLIAPNRGDITVSEFAENFNHYQKYFQGYYFSNSVVYYLDEDGNWTRKKSLEELEGRKAITERILPNMDYTLNEDGKIQRITVTYQNTGNSSIFMFDNRLQLQMIVLSFIESQETFPLFTNDAKSITSLTSNLSQDFSFTLHGVSVSYTVQYTGLYPDPLFIYANEDDSSVQISYTLIMDLNGGAQ